MGLFNGDSASIRKHISEKALFFWASFRRWFMLTEWICSIVCWAYEGSVLKEVIKYANFSANRSCDRYWHSFAEERQRDVCEFKGVSGLLRGEDQYSARKERVQHRYEVLIFAGIKQRHREQCLAGAESIRYLLELGDVLCFLFADTDAARL